MVTYDDEASCGAGQRGAPPIFTAWLESGEAETGRLAANGAFSGNPFGPIRRMRVGLLVRAVSASLACMVRVE
ncbi:MAG TPA: hypothetical protein VH302_03845 [Bryobacteraceae bacterium]|jgi:hypothetical protein|nr:hypothetical protein [Bryobacteraceae bacterium]